MHMTVFMQPMRPKDCMCARICVSPSAACSCVSINNSEMASIVVMQVPPRLMTLQLGEPRGAGRLYNTSQLHNTSQIHRAPAMFTMAQIRHESDTDSPPLN